MWVVDIVYYLFSQSEYIKRFISVASLLRLLNLDIPELFDSLLPEAWEIYFATLEFLVLRPIFAPTRVRDCFDAMIHYKLDYQTFYYGAAYKRILLL